MRSRAAEEALRPAQALTYREAYTFATGVCASPILISAVSADGRPEFQGQSDSFEAFN